MRAAQERLLALVRKIFDDGVVTFDERQALRALYAEAKFTVGEVKAVFRAFLAEVWGEVIADGVLTPSEQSKLATIVRELRLPLDCVPADVALVLAIT
jgi:hypothetical protein